jgi:hypothetical protein
MNIFHIFTKPVRYTITTVMLVLSMYVPVTNAAMVDTGAVMNSTQTQNERSRIQDTLNRDEVKAKLSSLGVDPAQIEARVNALTGSEAQLLAANLEQMPAGGGVSLLLLILILILLI